MTIDNITYAYAQAAHGDGFLEEFMLRPEDRERIDKYGKLADDLHTDLHECLGHGSGQLAPGVKGGELKNYTSTLEEARADLSGSTTWAIRKWSNWADSVAGCGVCGICPVYHERYDDAARTYRAGQECRGGAHAQPQADRRMVLRAGEGRQRDRVDRAGW